uniref:Uncharacterized protein n=1 Tax=Molossus molossus TaxID=27622 RepID=A0A7J8I186_MOLMO|nr:hypothetical protein HJG59_010828 [Molossus molossus]
MAGGGTPLGGADQVWRRPSCLPADSSTGFPLLAIHRSWPASPLPWVVNKPRAGSCRPSTQGAFLCACTPRSCAQRAWTDLPPALPAGPCGGQGSGGLAGTAAPLIVFFLYREDTITIEAVTSC